MINFPRRRFAMSCGLFCLTSPMSAFGNSESSPGTLQTLGPSGNLSGIFPLSVSPSRRHLVDANNRPFFIHGDAAWSLVAQLSRKDADIYLSDRRNKGFNTILVNLIEHEFAAAPPKNYYGETPFLPPGDFEAPNESYFEHVDQLIGSAAEKGFLILLAPAYMGFEGGHEGWYQEMKANGPAKLKNYGRYLGKRFRKHANILWVHGGDFNPPETVLLRALVSGIRDNDTRSLNTFHGSRGTSATDFLGTAEAWLQVSSIYTGATDVVHAAMHEYSRFPRPFFLIEARYEGEGANAVTVRLQAYQTILSGGCGHVMGNLPIWRFGEGWQRALNSNGAQTLVYLRRLIERYAWSKLRPDFANTFLIEGVKSTSDRAVAAIANDGSFGLLYMPSARSVTLNLAMLAGPKVRVHWYDPTTGDVSTLPGLSMPASGSRTFVPYAHNASGDSDWVLVLESER